MSAASSVDQWANWGYRLNFHLKDEARAVLLIVRDQLDDGVVQDDLLTAARAIVSLRATQERVQHLWRHWSTDYPGHGHHNVLIEGVMVSVALNSFSNPPRPSPPLPHT